MKKFFQRDPLWAGSIIALVIIGIIMVAGSSYPEGVALYGDGLHFIKRHLIFLFLGIIVFSVTSMFPLKKLRKMSKALFLISLGLSLLLYTPLGVGHWGSVRWLNIPFTGIEFQPSDILKFTSILFFGDFLLRHKHSLRKGGVFLQVLVILGVSVGPIIFRDLSSATVIAAPLVAMFFLMGISVLQWIVLFVGAVAGGFLMIFGGRYSYRYIRLTSFLDPFNDIANTDWQLAHSLYALGIGGFFGQGLFSSRLKAGYLPSPYNDFIFSVIGEEWGFLGSAAVVLLYMIFAVGGYRWAKRVKDPYEKLVFTGIVTSLWVQAFFNMGVCVGILPVTGITLPLISYGGTALLVTFGALGILNGIMRRNGE